MHEVREGSGVVPSGQVCGSKAGSGQYELTGQNMQELKLFPPLREYVPKKHLLALAKDDPSKQYFPGGQGGQVLIPSSE